MLEKSLSALLTVLAGVGGALLLFWLLNKLAELLAGAVGGAGSSRSSTSSRRISRSPSTSIYPAIQTVDQQLQGPELHRLGGLRELHRAAHRPTASAQTLFNTLLWIVIVPGGDGDLRARDRGARRPAEAEVGEPRQDDHLPADGDQHDRRRHRLGLHLRGPPQGPAADRAPERDHRGLRLRPRRLAAR